ncbi:MAG TPA: C4-type zinc ribbon domain-containing protein [Terriglobales bacterium]|jgi:predicted  nucleic acid-binding Zn-ribbon protein|nr:C4-type zinc ribbon domain-containing protein [Terriglobales bacterium]
MHPDLERLKSLQDVDREIQRLNDEIATLPRRVADVEAKLAAAKGQIEQEKTRIKQNDAAKRSFESEIQSQQQKISKYREQSLDVKTNEQYKALLHEIEFAEKEIREHEEKILVTMVEAETHEKSLKAAEAEFKTQGVAIEKEKAEVRARSEQDEKALAEWQSKRQELRGGISASTLEHYDRILPARKTALAEAIGQKCAACNVMLRPQKYDEIKTNSQIMTCDSCSRILFYDPSHEPPPAPAKPARKRKSKSEPTDAAAEESAVETDRTPVSP